MVRAMVVQALREAAAVLSGSAPRRPAHRRWRADDDESDGGKYLNLHPDEADKEPEERIFETFSQEALDAVKSGKKA